MLTSNELIETIESLEDTGIDLSFEVVMLQFTHRLRPDVPITIYLGGDPEYRDELMGGMN